MECCNHKFFWILVDPEFGTECLAPLDALYCPVCGTPLIPGAV